MNKLIGNSEKLIGKTISDVKLGNCGTAIEFEDSTCCVFYVEEGPCGNYIDMRSIEEISLSSQEFYGIITKEDRIKKERVIYNETRDRELALAAGIRKKYGIQTLSELKYENACDREENIASALDGGILGCIFSDDAL